MGCEVYANGDEIACKAGDGKVIAAFPDVCLSPPSPPAGPVPLPYPNTSFSKDMKSGSKTVMIKGKEVMLKDQSFYKTSPLGDEAATNGLGASVVTHVITGKTYFVAWSMDVNFEGQNVDRHTDMTTSNHASPNGATPPWANLSEEAMAEAKKICRCCKQPPHSDGEPMDGKTWYAHRAEVEGPRPAREAKVFKGNKPPKAAISAKSVEGKKKEAADQIARAEKRDGCICKDKGTKVLPEDPCNAFYSLPPAPDPVTKTNQKDRATKQSEQTGAIDDAWGGKMGGGIHQKWEENRKKKAEAEGKEYKPCAEVMHLVPKAAGGCPGNAETGGNLQCKDDLCGPCRAIDDAWKGDKGKDIGGMQELNFPETSAKL